MYSKSLNTYSAVATALTRGFTRGQAHSSVTGLVQLTVCMVQQDCLANDMNSLNAVMEGGQCEHTHPM